MQYRGKQKTAEIVIVVISGGGGQMSLPGGGQKDLGHAGQSAQSLASFSLPI